MLAATFSDPEHARIIFLAAGGLIVLAIALAAGTVWWWRTSAVEHPALGPLEVMGTKPFLLADDDTRHEILESARPGAQLSADEPEAHDEQFVDLAQDDFDALRDDSLAGLLPQDDVLDRMPAVAAAPEAPAARAALFDQAIHDDSAEVPAVEVPAVEPGPAPQVIRTQPQPAPAPRPIDPLLRNDDRW